MERVDQPNDSDKDDATIGTKTVSTEAAENSASSYIQFKCYQCSYESASDKGVRQHIRIQHIISQLDRQDDCEVNKSDSEKNFCPDNWPICYYLHILSLGLGLYTISGLEHF